jgi:hypothetical protein
MTESYSWGLNVPRRLSATFQTDATLSSKPAGVTSHEVPRLSAHRGLRRIAAHSLSWLPSVSRGLGQGGRRLGVGGSGKWLVRSAGVGL